MILFQDGVITGLAEPAKNRRKYWIKQAENLIPMGIDKWESGSFDLNGNKEANILRIRLASFIDVKANTIYQCSSGNIDYPLLIRVIKNDGTVRNAGEVNGTFTTQEGETQIAVSINSHNTNDTFNTYKPLFISGAIKPVIKIAVEEGIFVLNKQNEYEQICKDNWILLKKDTILPKWSSNAVSIDFSKYKYLRFVFHESTNASCKVFEVPVVNMNLTRTEQNFYVWLNKEHNTIDVRINADSESYSLCDIYGLA